MKDEVIRFGATCDMCKKLIDISGYTLGTGIDYFCSRSCALKYFEMILTPRTITEMLHDRAWVDWQIQKFKEILK